MLRKRAAFVAALAVVLVFGAVAAPSAFAAATWSKQVPAPNAVLSAKPPLNASVDAASTSPLVWWTGRITIDGVPRTTTTVPSGSYLAKLITTYPTGVSQDGTHTVIASIADQAGTVNTYAWQFLTAIPPTIGAPTPAAGTTIATTTPTISVPVSDNTQVASWSVTVNGSPTTATLSAGKLTLALAQPLEDDSVVTVALTVRDGLGTPSSSSWTYKVQVNADMAAVDCGDCHTDKAANTDHTDNADDCLECHYASPHAGTPVDYHVAANTTACRPCHNSNLTIEHQKHGLTCQSCHASAVAEVSTAIAAGDSACDSCHPGSATHTTVHETPVAASCTGSACHTGTSLTTIHMGPSSTTTCDSCHASTDPAVSTAISTGNKDCNACHGANAHDGLHATTVVETCAGSGCHTGTTLTDIHAGSGCSGCHASTDSNVAAAIAAGDRRCTTCHPTTSVHTSVHDAAVTPSCAGSSCHQTPNLTALHLGAGSTLTCGSCHASTDPNVISAIAANNKDCAACHGSAKHVDLHATTVSAGCAGAGCHSGTNLTGVHSAVGCAACHESSDPAVATAISTGNRDCTACHSSSGMHVAIHDTSVSPGCSGATCHQTTNLTSLHFAPGSTLTCASCHASSDPNVTGAIAANNKDCVACHGSAKHTDLHTTTVAAGCAGTGCHSGTNLTGIHTGAGCAGCHASTDSDVTTAISTGNRTCSVCHNQEGTDYHVGIATAHSVNAGESCSSCHEGASLTTIHSVPGCAGCHGSTNPTVTGAIAGGDHACSACHGATPHGDLTVAHTATMTSASLKVWDDHYGYASVVWPLDCSMCHATTDLTKIHGQDCNACHAGAKPANSFTTWNKSCSQGACHPTIEHTAGPANHAAIDCETCHDGDTWTVYGENCDSCHNTSTNGAPVTTSNVKTSYVGPATITLTSPRIAYTFYRLDGGTIRGGTTVLVPAPTSGAQVHTLEFWSVDDYGLEELPHKTATFTVSAP